MKKAEFLVFFWDVLRSTMQEVKQQINERDELAPRQKKWAVAEVDHVIRHLDKWIATKSKTKNK